MMNAASTAALFNSMGDIDNAAARIPSVGKAGAMSATQIDKVAQDFESMFIGQMMEPMFGESVGEDAFGDKETDEIYKGLMMDEYGKQVTRAGGIGIADYVKRELLKLQETSPHGAVATNQLKQ